MGLFYLRLRKISERSSGHLKQTRKSTSMCAYGMDFNFSGHSSEEYFIDFLVTS